MDWLFFVAGILLVILGVWDLLNAAMGTGGGFIGRNFIKAGWLLAVWISEKTNLGRRFLRIFGIGVNLFLILLWIFMITLGWTLVFSASEWSVISQSTQLPAPGLINRLQFTVSTILGLGRGVWQIGDIAAWKLLALVTSLIGTFSISFTISFLIPILQASTLKRSLAHQIFFLGRSPVKIIQNHCIKGETQAFHSKVLSLVPELIDCFEKHRTYPTLNFFLSTHRFNAMALNVVTFDETLTLLKIGFPDDYLKYEDDFEATRGVLSRLLKNLRCMYILEGNHEPFDEALSSKELSALEGFDSSTFEEALSNDELTKRRRDLGTLLRNNGWKWKDVYGTETGE